jgi:O-methyltransferase
LIQRFGFDVIRTDKVVERANTSDLESDKAFVTLLARCRSFTMTSPARMYALYQAIDHIHTSGLKGDVVECGVWRGGSSMLAALALVERRDTDRTLYLYDTFAGMSEPTEKDRDLADTSARTLLDVAPASADADVWARAELDEVRRNLFSSGYPRERIKFIRGRVEDTIPETLPESIALLRLDTDWYESTFHELEHLFPRLVNYGVLIIDDYGHWKGAKEAVDEYFKKTGFSILLNRIDYTGRIGVKTEPSSQGGR